MERLLLEAKEVLNEVRDVVQSNPVMKLIRRKKIELQRKILLCLYSGQASLLMLDIPCVQWNLSATSWRPCHKSFGALLASVIAR